MSFSFVPFQGLATEYTAATEGSPSNSREAEVLPHLTTAVQDVVEALGGYVSVDVRGNILPAPGETGESINVLIASLTPPAGVTLNAPVAPETKPPAEQTQLIPDPEPAKEEEPAKPVEVPTPEPAPAPAPVPEQPAPAPVQPVAPVVAPVEPTPAVAPVETPAEPVAVAA